MIVICGVREFPSGPWTRQLASDFADRVDADLVLVDGQPVSELAQVASDGEVMLIFGHAPERRIAATLRDAPCPVVIAPGGTTPRDWGEVIIGVPGDRPSEEAGSVAGELARRAAAPLRVIVAEQETRTTWEISDELRRVTDAAAQTGGPDVEVQLELGRGRAAEVMATPQRQGDGRLVVLAADPRPRGLGRLRRALIPEILHLAGDLVVAVPPLPQGAGTTRALAGAARDRSGS
jgi:hypothetical protein